ncbi:unnamed protein product [Blepharisma stoltei]|uniref:Uncharacterized protein n=1 Tax=Blepharisma stoltei TaxID=1481888 RepID=A0AAU9KCE2_9CILI|nr:unnamed protein product [Blepharisma stoltei]
MEPASCSEDEFYDACETEDQIALYQRSATMQYNPEPIPLKSNFLTISVENPPSNLLRSYTEAIFPISNPSPTEELPVIIENPKPQSIVLIDYNVEYKTTKKDSLEFNNLQFLQEIDLPHKESNIICVAKFSLDSRMFAVAGSNGKIMIFDINSSADGILSNDPSHILTEHAGPVTDISWGKENNLLSSSADKTVKMWVQGRLNSMETVQHPCEVNSVCYNPMDSNYFVTATKDMIIRLFKLPEKVIEGFYQAPGEISCLCYSPSGEFLAVGADKGQVLLYQGRFDYKLRLGATLLCRNRRGLKSGGKRVTGLEFIDNDHLCVTTNDSNIRLYRYKENLLLQKFKGTENIKYPIRSSLSEDGEYLLCGSEKGRIYIWNTMKSSEMPGKNNFFESFYPRKKRCTEYALFAPRKIVDLVQAGIENDLLEIKHVIFTVGSKQNIRIFVNQRSLENN